MQRTLSASGKLFLSGEYAVLWGGASRIAAVGPRTQAYVQRRQDKHVRLLQEGSKLTGFTTPLGVRWQEDVPPNMKFAAWAVDLALRTLRSESLGLDLALQASPTAPGGRKWGLGSSARATVLTAEAVRFVLEASFDPLKLALLAHFEAQGGQGSGGDVAAVFAGGVVRYRRYDLRPLVQGASSGSWVSSLLESPAVDLWRLPTLQLPLIYAYSGKSSQTAAVVPKIEASLSEAEKQAFVDESDTLGQALEEGFLKGDFLKTQVAVESLQKLLASLGPLVTPAISRILEVAHDAGSAGKISGAGQGDGCILFTSDAEHQAYVLHQLKENGIAAFPVSIEEGIRSELQPEKTLRAWVKE